MRLRGVVAVAAAAGIALRVWILTSSQGALDGDEAVWGLIAGHIRKGIELPAFFWHQGYGGTQEAYLTVPFFAAFGASAATLRIVPIALEAVAAVLVWRVGRRTIGEPAARLAAALFWLWPSYALWKATRAHGFYGSTLVLGLVVLLLALRLTERSRTLDLAALGLALGCGWWASPQIVVLAFPALAWAAWKRPRALASAAIVLPATLIGAAPWIATNLHHDWYSTHVLADSGGPLSRLHALVTTTLPTALGLRVPFSLDWLGTVWVGVPLYLLVLVALVAPRRDGVQPLLLALFGFPILYALSPYASSNMEPRYLWLLLPVLALLVARWASTLPRGIAVLAVAAALSTAGFAAMVNGNLTAPRVEDAAVPADLDPLLRRLREHRVTRVWANYWIAWRITFESGERIVAASTGTGVVRYERLPMCVVPVGVDPGRYPPYFEVVRSAPRAAFVFVSDTAVAAHRLLERAGYRDVEAGGFDIELPRRQTRCTSNM